MAVAPHHAGASAERSASQHEPPAPGPRAARPGEHMSAAVQKTPSREDFAALLDESFGKSDALEGSVIKGKVVAIEKDMAVIDVGLKTEGRVALREFAGPGREGALESATRSRSISTASRTRSARPSSRATRRAARRAGSSSRSPTRRTRRSTASSSTRSRAATRSTSTAPWRSCRARRSTSARSATSPR